MEQLTTTAEFKSNTQSVITIGTFDGVHVGHRAIMQRLVAAAKEQGLVSAVLTFFLTQEWFCKKTAISSL